MGSTSEIETLPDDSDESLAAATEELVFRVVQPRNLEFDELIRRFPEAAEFLRVTSPILPRESTAGVTGAANQSEAARDEKPAERHDGTVGGPALSGILARGEALEICGDSESDLKNGLHPSIEDRIHDVAEPQRSALLVDAGGCGAAVPRASGRAADSG